MSTVLVINDQVELHYYRQDPILERFSGICYVNSGCFAVHIIIIPSESKPYSTMQRTIFELTHWGTEKKTNFVKNTSKNKIKIYVLCLTGSGPDPGIRPGSAFRIRRAPYPIPDKSLDREIKNLSVSKRRSQAFR